MKELDNSEYMDELAKKIRHGISPEVALQTTENKRGETISIPTLYLRIDRGLMKCKNIHLRNKLKRMPKEEKEQEKRYNKNKHRANGRSYGDLSEEERKNKLDGFGEMDTVEGVKGSKMLMTLINRKTSFLFGIPISNKKQENIIKELDKLEITMKDKFKLILEKIITDNGCEFLDYEGIEPYKEMEKIIGKELLSKLGFYEKALEDLNMTRKKVA